MYVIVEIAGLQYKVEQDQQLYVNRLAGEPGDKVTFDKVLLSDNGSVVVGAPVIDGMMVEASIVQHVKGDKVIVFKKKRRKGYKKKNGHRQQFTKIAIEAIGAGKGGSKPAKKAEQKPEISKEAPKAAVEENSPAKEEKPKKETAAKKEEPKAQEASKKAKGHDDLTKIEGIGPKAAEALVAAGVDTYAKLAKTDADKVKEILTEASGRLAHLDPTTWAEQSELAADDKWDELKALQDQLDGGKK